MRRLAIGVACVAITIVHGLFAAPVVSAHITGRAHVAGAALVIMCVVVGWVYWMARALSLSPEILGERWYELRAFERDGAVYEWLGIRAFRFVLLHTPLALFNRDLRVRRARGERARIERAMRQAEMNHAIAFVFTLPAAAAMSAIHHDLRFAAWMMLANALYNAYPVFLQRWNRGRLSRAARARR